MNNILDLIFVNNNHPIDDVTVLPPFLNWDYNSIVITMQSVSVGKTTSVKGALDFYAGMIK